MTASAAPEIDCGATERLADLRAALAAVREAAVRLGWRAHVGLCADEEPSGLGRARLRFLVCYGGHDRHAVCRSWSVDGETTLIVSRPTVEADFAALGHEPLYGCQQPAVTRRP